MEEILKAFEFKVGGGTDLSFDYEIMSGPDKGRRLTWLSFDVPRWDQQFTRLSQEAWEARFGAVARPGFLDGHRFSRETLDRFVEFKQASWRQSRAECIERSICTGEEFDKSAPFPATEIIKGW